MPHVHPIGKCHKRCCLAVLEEREIDTRFAICAMELHQTMDDIHREQATSLSAFVDGADYSDCRLRTEFFRQ